MGDMDIVVSQRSIASSHLRVNDDDDDDDDEDDVDELDDDEPLSGDRVTYANLLSHCYCCCLLKLYYSNDISQQPMSTVRLLLFQLTLSHFAPSSTQNISPHYSATLEALNALVIPNDLVLPSVSADTRVDDG
jgi:hypothetical protein